jgi:hypothetical protein
LTVHTCDERGAQLPGLFVKPGDLADHQLQCFGVVQGLHLGDLFRGGLVNISAVQQGDAFGCTCGGQLNGAFKRSIVAANN